MRIVARHTTLSRSCHLSLSYSSPRPLDAPLHSCGVDAGPGTAALHVRTGTDFREWPTSQPQVPGKKSLTMHSWGWLILWTSNRFFLPRGCGKASNKKIPGVKGPCQRFDSTLCHPTVQRNTVKCPRIASIRKALPQARIFHNSGWPVVPNLPSLRRVASSDRVLCGRNLMITENSTDKLRNQSHFAQISPPSHSLARICGETTQADTPCFRTGTRYAFAVGDFVTRSRLRHTLPDRAAFYRGSPLSTDMSFAVFLGSLLASFSLR